MSHATICKRMGLSSSKNFAWKESATTTETYTCQAALPRDLYKYEISKGRIATSLRRRNVPVRPHQMVGVKKSNEASRRL
jgi:hypothetical protein